MRLLKYLDSMKLGFYLVTVFVSENILAESSDALSVVSQTSSKDISGLSNWPIVLIILIGMIGFIFSLGWFVRRFGGLNFSGNRDMKVVTSIAFGAKERVALIDIKGQQFLIGVTSQQITHLHSFNEAVIPVGATDSKIKESDFVAKFQNILNSKVIGTSESSIQKTSEDRGYNENGKSNVP